MNSEKRPSTEDMANSLFGDAISHYSRGEERMERHAMSIIYPSIAALKFPEEYAFLVLATRMDLELKKIILNGLHKQGNPNRLFGRVLSNFAAKIGIAYGCGFITEQMYRAIELVRNLRNLYAHAEDPSEVRGTDKYLSYRSDLIELDRDTTNYSAQKLHELHLRSNPAECHPIEDFELIGILVAICDNLGTTAFFSMNGPSMPQQTVIPAFYAFSDAPEIVTVGGRSGFFPRTSALEDVK